LLAVAAHPQATTAIGSPLLVEERAEFELSGDFIKSFSKPLSLFVAVEKLTGAQPSSASPVQVIEHQALEFAGQ